MPPRRRDENSVVGPNSALTLFLREQGINANAIRQRHLARVSQQETEQDQQEEEEIRLLAREKRRRLNSDDEEEDEDGDFETMRKSLPGEEISCVECRKTFKVTVYTREFIKDGTKGYLCEECNELQKIKLKKQKQSQWQLRKKRQLVAKSLLDQREYRLPSLQDLCISLISQNIDNVDKLGDIGNWNYVKLSKILSKNRSLNNSTLQLFLMTNLKEIQFWDCSNIDSVNFDKMIYYCPNLESVTLSMCGQFNNENLLNLLNLQNLKHIDLNGPFLINEKTWQTFFEAIGDRLHTFKLNNTHRFNDLCLLKLLECPNLSQLSLQRLDGLQDEISFELLPHYCKKLTSLQLSYLKPALTDQIMINIMQENDLESLILHDCQFLTNEFLVGLQFCPMLQKLTLSNFNLTNSNFAEVFKNWSNNGLMELDLSGNILLDDESVLAVVTHSKNSLIKLNLNSCKSLTPLFWKKLPQLPLLTIFDCGFVRSMNNTALRTVMKNCPSLAVIEVYGNNKCNDITIERENLKIIGREIDTI